MKFNRRNFIKTTGGAALATVAASFPVYSSLFQNKSSKENLRVAIFFQPGFHAIDFATIELSTLKNASQDYETQFLNVTGLTTKLNAKDFDVFVNPYGSAFPVDAWITIQKYLSSGGNWVNIGGVPFSVPVYQKEKLWSAGISQTEYHKKLGITQAFPVKADGKVSIQPNAGIEGTHDLPKEFTAEKYYELYVRFSNSKEYPDEDGSTGPKEAVLHPLVSIIDDDKRSIAAPIIQIDRLQGEFAGGRWVLANFKGTITGKGIRSLINISSQGSLEFVVQPSYACYHEGETPSFSVGLRRPSGEAAKLPNGRCKISVVDSHNKHIGDAETTLTGEGSIAAGAVYLNVNGDGNLAPGLYEAHCTIEIDIPLSSKKNTLHYTTRFWILDNALLSSGTALEMDSDYFTCGGEPYPVIGTTYMASDAHRKFLIEPNPNVWNNDFAQMKAAGINMVRTGIWSGWKNYMSDAGVPNEAALRAMDAFVLTARKYDISVIFTFFAFIPESWGGSNAYIDPKSIDAQKKFISMFTSRYGMVNDILWDLINEPSFCNPNRLWSTRPNYDAFELAAWNDWLKERGGSYYENYRERAGEPVSLPALEDFDNANIFNDYHPIKVIDYRLFAQDMFAKWVGEMRDTIRANGNAKQLITVGQDEGGTIDRANPQFFKSVISFTCIHNWWFNDDLVWDSVMTKTPGVPNLVEETGVMFYENMDGSSWRSEEEARNLLERKLAISMGTAGAGFIEWIWNTNPYMFSDNEAAIGLLRVDGSAKPELEPVIEFARFFDKYKHHMQKRIPENVVMVIPNSQMFSTRNFATEATQRCIRIMYCDVNIPVSAISEYRVRDTQVNPKLIIVPSPRVFKQDQWEYLVSLVSRGSTLLLTGVIDADEHWLPIERMKQFGFDPRVQPVMNEELLRIEGKDYVVGFRGDKLQRIEKAAVDASGISNVFVSSLGEGKIIWSPLPVEVSDSPEAVQVLYNYALAQAKISPMFSVEKHDPSFLILPVVYDKSVLYTFVSETDRIIDVKLTHLETNTPILIQLPAQRTVSLFIDRKDGHIIGRRG